jgi:D-glycero-alpha-D-manno-heptose-7-phosphate kinase
MSAVIYPESSLVYCSKAPLRIGLAGGGTDVSPYTDQYGGAVLNAAISLYAHARIELFSNNIIVITDDNTNQECTYNTSVKLPIDGKFDLVKGVYNYFLDKYIIPPSGLKISVSVDTPIRSGLGTSSTLMVAIIGAFCAWLNVHLSQHEIACLAYDIERNHLGFAGGRQDQFAASYGGLNYMEFHNNGDVVVNPLLIEEAIIKELENNLVLYYTGHSRQSGAIIREQQQNVLQNHTHSVEAMHQLKEQSKLMRNALMDGNLHTIGELFDYGFEHKRKMAGGISTPAIEEIYAAAKLAGATGGKISGAGGGGFMFFYCPNGTRSSVIETLANFAGQVWGFTFEKEGVKTYTTQVDSRNYRPIKPNF